jgi:hypothetical protein
MPTERSGGPGSRPRHRVVRLAGLHDRLVLVIAHVSQGRPDAEHPRTAILAAIDERLDDAQQRGTRAVDEPPVELSMERLPGRPVVGPMVRTVCDNAYMSVNVSVRLDDGLAERLRIRARAAGESLSDRLRRYAEEGARRDEHPLITFRDGPTGRRAGVMGGPDVWEVAMWVEDLADESDPVVALAEDGVVTRPQIDAAMRYRVAYPDEIAARIELHRRETAAADMR